MFFLGIRISKWEGFILTFVRSLVRNREREGDEDGDGDEDEDKKII